MVSLSRKVKGLFVASILVKCRGPDSSHTSAFLASQGRPLLPRASHIVIVPIDIPRTHEVKHIGLIVDAHGNLGPRRFHEGRTHIRASETPCKGRRSPGGINHWIIVALDVNSPSYEGSLLQKDLLLGSTPRNTTSF